MAGVAERLTGAARELDPGHPAELEEVDAALSAAELLVELESTIRQIMGQVTAESHRGPAVRADRLARLLQDAGAAGRDEASLVRNLQAALQRARKVMPAWWLSDTSEPFELERIEATMTALLGNELGAAILATEQAARDVFAAVIGSWQPRADGIVDTARPIRDWLGSA